MYLESILVAAEANTAAVAASDRGNLVIEIRFEVITAKHGACVDGKDDE